VAKDEFAGAETIRYAACNWKIIEPHDNMMEEMYEHLLRESCIR
jgi:hypothetical protein